MGNSRKTQKKRPIIGEQCCEATYHGINEWYKAKFEKLGWMLLAQRYGMMDKVMAYQNSIKRLHVAIDQKMRKMHDKDKKADLALMKKNIEFLLEHVKADFA